jgi:hypothetical protein
MMIVWATMLISIGCGTWLGNPKDPDKTTPPPGNSMVTLKIRGESAAPLQLAANVIDVIGTDGTTIGTLTLTQARLSLKEIKLKLHASDAEERQLFNGPYVVNLLTNQVLPDPGTIEVPDGTYTDIQLKLAKLEKDEIGDIVAASDPLIERSIYLTGSYKPEGGTAVSVTMDFDLDEEFVLGSSAAFAGVDIVAGQNNPVIIAFRLDRWFDFRGSDTDLSDVQGEIVLIKDADDVAKDVREAIKENVKQSAKFGKDADGDGNLGEDEDSEDD